jgi:PmbA protein
MTPAASADGLFTALFEAAARGEGEGAELYERRGAALELTEDEDGTRVVETRERGFALRLFRAGRVAFAASGPEGARALFEHARLLLPRARVKRGARPPAPGPDESPGPAAPAGPASPDEPAAREVLVAFRRALVASGGGAVTIRDATISVGARSERIATTAGRDAAWESRAAALVTSVVGRGASGRFSARVVATAARLEELPVARIARHAADRVLLPLDGKALPPGRVDLLLDPHVASPLIARLAPLFFGDDEDLLLSARTRGGRDRLTAPILSLIDDGAAPGGPVHADRDGEGTLRGRTVVCHQGVPVARLTDTASAARRCVAPSGNSVRRSWSEPPALGVTNFFVDPSPGLSPVDLLAGIVKGLYAAVLLERPEVDLAANRFRLTTAGYWIEHGRAAARIAEAVISGRLSELMRGVAAIGDDLKFVPGAGGAVGSSTLWIPRWKSE